MNDHDEPMQEVWIRMQFPVKQFPFDRSHQQALIGNYFTPKGVKLVKGEDGDLIIQ